MSDEENEKREEARLAESAIDVNPEATVQKFENVSEEFTQFKCPMRMCING